MVLAFDIRHVALVIWRRVGGFRRYRRLTAAVRDSFPDASAEQLAGGECAICMERMKVGGGGEREAGEALLLCGAGIVSAGWEAVGTCPGGGCRGVCPERAVPVPA